jgi:hypothetical protein
VLDMAVTTVGSLQQAFVSKPGGFVGAEESEKASKKPEGGGDGRDSHSDDSDVDSLLEVHD